MDESFFLLDRTPPDRNVSIRVATPEDAEALERLGDLDERTIGAEPHLVADEHGTIVAALSLRDGTVTADPFRRTAASVSALRAAAGAASPPARGRRGRKWGLRAVLQFAVGLLAAGAAATALAATQSVTIGGGPVTIDTATKRFAIAVTCHSDSDPCQGVLDVRTAAKIKPYSSQPAQVYKVGTFPFSIAAGATVKVPGRVYGAALAHAAQTGQVRLSLVAYLGKPVPAGSRIVTFTHKRR